MTLAFDLINSLYILTKQVYDLTLSKVDFAGVQYFLHSSMVRHYREGKLQILKRSIGVQYPKDWQPQGHTPSPCDLQWGISIGKPGRFVVHRDDSNDKPLLLCVIH